MTCAATASSRASNRLSSSNGRRGARQHLAALKSRPITEASASTSLQCCRKQIEAAADDLDDPFGDADRRRQGDSVRRATRAVLLQEPTISRRNSGFPSVWP